MSETIVLDVTAPPTVRLDAGNADPVARDEIAALETRVDGIAADYVPRAEVSVLDADDIDGLFS